MKIDREKVLLLQAQRGFTGTKLAKEAHIAPSRLSVVLCQRLDIRPPTVGRIAASLGVEPAAIVLQEGGASDG